MKQKEGQEVRQQDLAGFGRRAVEGADLEQLLADAAREAAEGLGVKFVKVLQYLPEEQSFLVRAGVGWHRGVIGHTRIGSEMASPAGFALRTGEPVIANDLDHETRFRIPDLLREHKVKSAVNVIIQSKNIVFGVLEADSRESGAFDDDDVKFLQGYANILAFVIEQARLVASNAELARRQEILLHELQHRIANNNQQLLSLINLQLTSIRDPETRDQLEQVASRILALGRLHERLRSAEVSDTIDLSQYIGTLLDGLFDFRSAAAADIKLETRIAPVDAGTEQAQALGLMINEFLTNSFKHAFAGRGGRFIAALETGAGDSAVLTLADDGPGMPRDAQQGLGLRLIETLARQIDAKLVWNGSAGAGTRLQVTFPVVRPGLQ
jgi:two-component sensor histidine kinase